MPTDNIIAFDPAVCRRLAIRAAGRHAIVSSVELAKRFDRAHRNVLRDIDELISHCSDLSSEMWFTPSVYRSSRGREEPACDMTRAGFVLLAMGWTGPKALAFKIAYIAAFDAGADRPGGRVQFRPTAPAGPRLCLICAAAALEQSPDLSAPGSNATPFCAKGGSS